ncbi:unnamed protein product, partial [Ectocarpus sp. 12 AP-2014]
SLPKFPARSVRSAHFGWMRIFRLVVFSLRVHVAWKMPTGQMVDCKLNNKKTPRPPEGRKRIVAPTAVSPGRGRRSGVPVLLWVSCSRAVAMVEANCNYNFASMSEIGCQR